MVCGVQDHKIVHWILQQCKSHQVSRFQELSHISVISYCTHKGLPKWLKKESEKTHPSFGEWRQLDHCSYGRGPKIAQGKIISRQFRFLLLFLFFFLMWFDMASKSSSVKLMSKREVNLCVKQNKKITIFKASSKGRKGRTLNM